MTSVRKANIHFSEDLSEKQISSYIKESLSGVKYIKLLKIKANIARIEFDKNNLEEMQKLFRSKDFVEIIDIDFPGCTTEFHDEEEVQKSNFKHKKISKISNIVDIEFNDYSEQLKEKLSKYK